MSSTASTPSPQAGLDSYVSFEDADALAAKLIGGEAWRLAVASAAASLAGDEAPATPALPPAECCRALYSASAILDRLSWAGERADRNQPLAWPRRGARDDRGWPVPAEYTPPALATACAELAFHLLATDQTARRAPVQMVQIGATMETYFACVADELPKHVRRIVEPFLAVRSTHSAELIF